MHSYDTSDDQLSVVQQLLDLYTSDTRVIDRARLMVEVASLRKEGTSEDDLSPPLSLLDEALSLLEPLISHPHSPPFLISRVHEQLAITHLWKAVCTHEQLVK